MLRGYECVFILGPVSMVVNVHAYVNLHTLVVIVFFLNNVFQLSELPPHSYAS